MSYEMMCFLEYWAKPIVSGIAIILIYKLFLWKG